VMRRSAAAAVFLSSACAFVTPASAAPRPVVLVERPTPPAAARTARLTIVHFAVASLTYHLRAAEGSPIRALPLTVQAAPIKLLTGSLPRFALVPLLAPLDWDDCGVPRSAVLLTSLPATPFTPTACERGLSTGAARESPTSLTPGHNKNALYGPAYSQHGFDTQ